MMIFGVTQVLSYSGFILKLWVCEHLVGLLGRGIGPPQGLFLHRTPRHRTGFETANPVLQLYIILGHCPISGRLAFQGNVQCSEEEYEIVA